MQGNLNLRLKMGSLLYRLERLALLFVPFKSKQTKIKQLMLQHCGVDSRKVVFLMALANSKMLFLQIEYGKPVDPHVLT